MNVLKQKKVLFFLLSLYCASIYGPMAAMSIGAGLFFSYFLITAEKSSWRSVYQSQLFYPSILVVISCVWSLLWAKLSGLTFYGSLPKISFMSDVAKLWHILFPMFLVAAFEKIDDKQFFKLVKIWFGLGIAIALLGIVQHYYPIYHPQELPDPGLRGLYHSTGMTGFHLSYSSILAFPMAMAVALLAVSIKRKSRFKQIIFLLGINIIFFIANIFTYSKIAWLAAPSMVLLLIFLGLKHWYKYLISFLIIIFAVYWWNFSEETRLRFQGTNTIRDRYEVWSANFEMIKQFPIFGVGWHHNSDLSHAYYINHGKSGFESHAHNNVIDQWATTGLLGLLAFIWWNVVLIYLAFKIYVSSKPLLLRCLGLGLIGGWFCLHLNGLTQANFWDAKVLHQIGWVAALTLDAHKRLRRGNIL